MADKVGDAYVKLNPTQQRVMQKLRNNPNITQPELVLKVGVGKTAIQNNISF